MCLEFDYVYYNVKESFIFHWWIDDLFHIACVRYTISFNVESYRRTRRGGGGGLQPPRIFHFRAKKM